jgi:glyceraldehyde-3-phosphate dehydrogenase type II
MESVKYNVLVNGMGNIGTTIANLLLRYRKDLQMNQLYVAKRSFKEWNKVERDFLEEQGAIICSHQHQNNLPRFAEILPSIHYIFEATANGVGLSNKCNYEQLPTLIGSSAQGSEKGYGIPFMTGVNDAAIRGQKFVNIVSCNTHGTAALLKTFCGNELENLQHADVVVVRRSEDLGNHERLVTANVVARHLDERIGTHHAIDVIDLYKTVGCSCSLTSSDITTPSQLMHSVRFNIELKYEWERPFQELIMNQTLIARTSKFDSNVIFEMGRRYGFNGRIFSHAIIIDGNVLVEKKRIKGWAFVPQEGNSILSTLHAYLLQMELLNAEQIMAKIKADLLRDEW